jgi:hypothetical protein
MEHEHDLFFLFRTTLDEEGFFLILENIPSLLQLGDISSEILQLISSLSNSGLSGSSLLLCAALRAIIQANEAKFN